MLERGKLQDEVRKNSGPLTGARSEEEEIGPALVRSRHPGGKALSTKIRCSGGTQLPFNAGVLEVVQSNLFMVIIKESKSSGANKQLKTEELLGRVADGEVEALEILYEELAPKLMGLLMRILSARPDAQSALQEVFVRLWKEAPCIAQSKGSLAAWLVLTSRHIALKRLRAQRAIRARPNQGPRGQGRPKEDKAAGQPGVSARKEDKPRERRATKRDSETSLFLDAFPQVWMPRAEDITLVDDRMGLLQRAFNQIPKPQRYALELAVFGGYTEAEIAEQLGEPLGKVNAGLRAAFSFLRHRQHAVLGTWTADI